MDELETYWFLYRCRCCGKIFAPESTINTWNNIIQINSDFCMGKDHTDVKGYERLTPHEIHYCDGNTMGFADFIGVTTDPDHLPKKSRGKCEVSW